LLAREGIFQVQYHMVVNTANPLVPRVCLLGQGLCLLGKAWYDVAWAKVHTRRRNACLNVLP
jgi:hypothetical protein